jgi:hypothetical protein
MPTVKQILTQYLKANGYDGLCNVDGWDSCGCTLADYAPCGSLSLMCRAAYDHGAINDCQHYMSTRKLRAKKARKS